MVTQSIALIQMLFTVQKERAKAIGWYGITLGIAAIIGQILVGYLAVTHFLVDDWRLIFFINVPVAIIAMLAIRKYLSQTDRETGVRFDYAGALVLTVGLGCLVYSTTEGREEHWTFWSIALLITGFVLIAYFFRD